MHHYSVFNYIRLLFFLIFVIMLKESFFMVYHLKPANFLAGKTYFFKGNGFWKFNDLRMRVEQEHQMLSAPFWMGCARNLEGYEQENKAPYTASSAHRSNFLSGLLIGFSLALKFYPLIA